MKRLVLLAVALAISGVAAYSAVAMLPVRDPNHRMSRWAFCKTTRFSPASYAAWCIPRR